MQMRTVNSTVLFLTSILMAGSAFCQEKPHRKLRGFGRYIVSLDATGDGEKELMVTAPADFRDDDSYGTIWVLDPQVKEIVSTIEASREAPIWRDVGLVPDVNGDGILDVVTQAPVSTVRSGKDGSVLCSTHSANLQFWMDADNDSIVGLKREDLGAAHRVELRKTAGSKDVKYELREAGPLGGEEVHYAELIPWMRGKYLAVDTRGSNGHAVVVGDLKGILRRSKSAKEGAWSFYRGLVVPRLPDPFMSMPVVYCGVPGFDGGVGAVFEFRIGPDGVEERGLLGSGPVGEGAIAEAPYQYAFGHSLLAGQDLTEDGEPDLVVAAPGEVFSSGVVCLSGDGTEVWDTRGRGDGLHVGVSLAWVGDLDDDGVEDFAAGSGEYRAWNLFDEGGAVILYSGATGAVILSIGEDWMADRM